MAQDLTVFNASYWAPEMQKVYFKENLARQIVNEELRNVLVDGTTVHKPYRSSLIDQAYSRASVISNFNELGGTDETLVVDTARVVPFYVDALDKIENKWDMAMIYASDAQRVINNRIDQAVLAEYPNAFSFVSAQDMGGSGTGSATVSLSNVSNLFTVAGRQLDKYNRGLASRFAVVGPRMKEIIKLSSAGRETAWGDSVGASGLVGPRFGFDVFMSNNIPFKAIFATDGTTQPAAGDTVTIDGVVFTAKDGAIAGGDAAGTFDARTDIATAMGKLVHAINGTGVAGTDYQAISDDDREQLRMGAIVASYQPTATNTLTINGYGDVVCRSASAGSLRVTLSTNEQYPLFGIKGAIDFVALKEPNVEFRKPSNRLGVNVFAWTYYGKKTFTKEKKSLAYAKVDTSNWV